jgi:hypothetical protein
MAAPYKKQIGAPVSVTIATPSLTITSIKRARPVRDPGLIEDTSSDKRVPLYMEGEEVAGFEFETDDAAALVALAKGTLVKTAVLTIRSAKPADANTDRPAEHLTATVTVGTVVSDNSPESVPGGRPASGNVRILCCQDPANGNEGTCTIAYSGS